jgi:hypothetical protein
VDASLAVFRLLIGHRFDDYPNCNVVGCLGIVGIFIPLPWLIGAVLPAKPGPRHAVDQATYCRTLMVQYTR